MKNKICNHCGQSACSWKPDQDYENMGFDDLEQEYFRAQRRVLGGWWIDYIPKCLVDKYHYLQQIYEPRDEKRHEVIRA